jgi:hypothetical protein
MDTNLCNCERGPLRKEQYAINRVYKFEKKLNYQRR